MRFLLEDVVCPQANAVLPNKPVEPQGGPSQAIPVTHGTVGIKSLVLCDALQCAPEADPTLNIEPAGLHFGKWRPVWVEPRVEILAANIDWVEIGTRFQIQPSVAARELRVSKVCCPRKGLRKILLVIVPG